MLSERFVEKDQAKRIRAIWPALKSATEIDLQPHARCDLLNRLLLTLAIRTVSFEFFETVFGAPDSSSIDFSDLTKLHERVDRFRALCMLEYGNFRFGYKQFCRDPHIRERWSAYFPSEKEKEDRASRMRARVQTIGLVPINPGRLFALGYLAREQKPRINRARDQLRPILDRALGEKVEDFGGVQRIAQELNVDDLTSLIAKSAIPGTEALIYPDLALLGGTMCYPEIVQEIRDRCVTVDEEAILSAEEKGLHNAGIYMTMHDLDVYVATSMRDPLHFTTNWAFVKRLFHEGELAEWKLRYFDPTQAFMSDRIQKGLMECLMIKRARLTVYNAQEADTFGKDSEAGLTLAQRKPVVVYVGRLFESLPDLCTIYDAIDRGARVERDSLIDELRQEGLLSQKEADTLLASEKTNADVLSAVIERHAPGVLSNMDRRNVAFELIRHGYDPDDARGDILKFALERIVKLERRALTFRDVHPLSLQTGADGVARGVIVTRTVRDTARVVRGILLRTLEYQITDDYANWLLLDTVTGSPVRVVTKDPVLTAAFWSEEWGT